ncbi:hypothetical protein GF312_11600 [Candidatus Poribacteria bacterium]|nr:hypothetical protein [Candidatus Poribacteria bacterium]
MIYALIVFTSTFLFTILPSSYSIPPSPADGGYLRLDGVDDYAFLDFDN